MILYFAGGAHQKILNGGDILESFWYKKDAETAMDHAGNFFLDSGAFTAFTKNVTIDIGEYCDFINRYNDKVTVASSLDAIGDPQKTYDNFHEMLKRGVNTIPVFHCREDFDWLRRYVAEGHTYIALGGMVPEHKGWVAKWLEQVWRFLVDEQGLPTVKVHGFGMTIFSLMEKYPWHSCDSSSWSYGGRFGAMLLIWQNGARGWVYIGENHGTRKIWGERHYSTLADEYKEYVDGFLKSVGSPTIEQLKANTNELNDHNIRVFQLWRSRLQIPRFIPQEGLF